MSGHPGEKKLGVKSIPEARRAGDQFEHEARVSCQGEGAARVLSVGAGCRNSVDAENLGMERFLELGTSRKAHLRAYITVGQICEY